MAYFGESASQHFNNNERNDVENDSDSSSGTASQQNLNGNGSARPPPKKRNRAALSCTLCRERKVKCDRVIPCQQCIKRGDAEFCHLDPNKRGPQSSVKVGHGKKQHSHLSGNQSSGEHGHHDPHGSLSTSSSAAEVDAIKLRLAQLEQALNQKNSGSESSPGFGSMSANEFSPSNIHSRMPYNNSSGHLPTFTTSPSNQQPTEQYPSPHYLTSHRSASSSISHPSPPKIPSFFSQASLGDGIVGRLPPIGNSPSPNGGGMGLGPFGFNTNDRSRNRASSAEMGHMAHSFAMPSNVPSMVKEGVVRQESEPTSNAHRGDVDSDTEDAALVLEGLAMGASRGDCDGKKLKSGSSVLDIIEKAPLKSIQSLAEQDKTKDIMIVDQTEISDQKACPEANRFSMGGGNPPLANSAEDTSSCNPNESACAELAELLKQNPDAEFGPDGKRIPPAKRVCILLSRHDNSLFNLVYGAETFLGWGMGWAFPAAEAAGDMMSVSDVVGCKGALQREAVLRAIIRSLPDRDSAEHLVNVFESRVKFLAGNCIHLPSFKKEMAGFYDLPTVEKRARAINQVDPAWLSLFLMVLVLALHFHPCERPDSIMHFFDGRTLHLWRSAAQTSLVLARYQSSQSISVLQTIILINLHSMGTGKDNYGLINVAITNAVEMGLHRLGSKGMQPKPGENSGISIRREIAKRIWHHFVFTDWCSAGMHGRFYRIHPSQFNTPLPGNYNDTDLCIYPLPPPRPSSEHTEMSFSLSQLQVAIVNREDVDMQNANEQDLNRLSCSNIAYLDGRYRGLLEQAPTFYKLGSEEGANENVEVERWLFLQSVFHKLLRLHRPKLSSKAGARTSCVMLARSILDLQSKIRSRCSVVDRLFLNLGQSFSAAIVLCLDLLQTPPTASIRGMLRGEVFEALKALRHVGASHHATESNIRVIEALLEEEEARWNQQLTDKVEGVKRKRDGTSGQLKKKNLLNLAIRVAKAANGKEQFKTSVAKAIGDEVEHGEGETMPDVTMLETNSKDEQSRQLLEQLMGGRPQYDEPSSFSTESFQSNAYGQPSNLVAPNGLDLSTQSFAPFSEDNGQPFDFEKFLAECDTNSSPGSISSGGGGSGSGVGGNYENMVGSGASDSGHSSLHGGASRGGGGGRRAASSSSSAGHLSHSSSQSQLGNSNEHSPLTIKDSSSLPAFVPAPGLSPNAVEQPTGLDGFWNWILNQGSMSGGGQNSIDSFKAPLGALQLAANTQSSQGQVQNSNSNTTNSNNIVPSQFHDLLARTLNADKKGGDDGHSNSAFSGGNATLNSSNNNYNNSNNNDATISLGTPSAGMGHSWMSTPGLFEFAYEFGNDANSTNSNTTYPVNNNNTSYSQQQQNQHQQQQQGNLAATSWS